LAHNEPAHADDTMTRRFENARKRRTQATERGKRVEDLVYGTMNDGGIDAAGLVEFSVPVFSKYNTAFTSGIYYRNPKLQVRRREGRGDVESARAIVERRKLEYYIHETNLMLDIKLAFAECRTQGTGFVELYFDEKHGRSALRWAPFKQVLVDPDTDDSPRIEDLMWCARERTYGLAHARKKWPKYEWRNTHGEPGDESGTESYRVGKDNMEGIGADRARDSLNHSGSRVRVLCVYLRGTEQAEGGDAPQMALDREPGEHEGNGENKDADKGNENADEPGGADTRSTLYENAKQVAYYEMGADGLYFIEKRKLDYVLDDFALIPLRVTTDTRGFYAHSVLATFYDLARQMESMLRIGNTQATTSGRSIWLLDEAVFTDEQERAIQDGPNNLTLRVKDVIRAENAIKRVDFGEPKTFVNDNARLNHEVFRDLSSIDAMTLGSPGAGGGVERSATGSALLDKRAQSVIKLFADEFEIFVAQVLRALSQMDRSLMTRDQVQKIIGNDIELDHSIWPNKWDEDAILGEYDVIIKSGSMRYASIEQQVADMNALIDRWIQFIAQIKDMATALGPVATALIVSRFFNGIIRQAELMQVDIPEEIVVGAKELLDALEQKPPEPPPAPSVPTGVGQPPAMPSPGTPPPAAAPPMAAPEGFTDQAIVEMAYAILEGSLDAQSAPPEAAMMASKILMERGEG
jgi:hypothetical protein